LYVLGVWDGHDSGAALIGDKGIVFAANEERFTKRKLEVEFPYNSIRAALAFEGIRPSDVEHVAFSTTEFTKTLERAFPRMKESYYQFRRRKIPRPAFENARHNLKYGLTGIGILPLCSGISRSIVASRLRSMGFGNPKIHVVEHHTAHAACAAFTSPFKRSLVVTLDGLGDGLSGSISTFENGKLERRVAIPARHSLGIMFEQVTNIVGMRELEDEGKVMAMADYSYPFGYEDSRLKDFFKVTGTEISARYGAVKQFARLQKIAWQMPREQFAYMAQQLLENMLVKFVGGAVGRYSIGDVVLAGGLFSNVKANMKIRMLDGIRHWYVFPHMGDGGLALGAALYAKHLIDGTDSYGFGAYLGDSYSAEQTVQELRKEADISYQHESAEEQASHASELISEGNYVFWFQDRMEYGPRALGDRSILAPYDSETVKERLNLYVKRREWYQPFAPSMLKADAERMLEFDGKGHDRFMTMAYMVKEAHRKKTASVMHIDGSARPQMVGEENPVYEELLGHMKKRTGTGMVLNTSFNIHGMPIVMSPADAVDTMKKTQTKYMFINGLFVTNSKGA
jgi:carbamoyltransferase